MKERAELLFTGLYGRVFDVEAHETGFTVRGAAPFVNWEPGGGPPRTIGYLRIAVDVTLYAGFAIVVPCTHEDDFIAPDRTGYNIAGIGIRAYLVPDEQDKWPAYVAYGDFLLIALKDTNRINTHAFSTRWVEDKKVRYAAIYRDSNPTVFNVGGSVVRLPDNYQELIFHPLKVR